MDLRPFARPARRGRRPAGETPTDRLGGVGGGQGALSTLELLPEPTGADEPESVVPADDLAADRFTVDLDDHEQLTGTPGPQQPPEPPEPPAPPTTAPWRVVARLVVVVVLSLLAFHHSVESLLQSVAAGSVVAYVLAVPFFAALAGAAAARRPGYQPTSGVRLVDVLLGGALCAVAVGLCSLLGPGLSGVYGLWRADLLMLWLFLLGASVLCFGLRQVARNWAFWLVLLLVWPYPVRVLNLTVGSSVGGAVLLVLVVLGVLALGHRPDDPARRRVLGSVAAAALLVGLLSAIGTHPARMVWPGVVAVAVATAWWATRAGPLPREPLVEPRTRGSALVLGALALVGVVVLPAAPPTVAPSIPTAITALSVGALRVPGFATVATTAPPDQQGRFGHDSTWQRVRLRQGDPDAGPALGGRDVVVDVISTPRPQALELYPVVTTYPMGTLSSVPDAEVAVGHGVRAQLFRAEDARHHIGYTLLTFSWRLPVDMSLTGTYTGPPAPLTQRVTLIALDDHDEDAVFPEPGNAALDGVRAAFERLGSPQVRPGGALLADEQLLSDAARALVEQRLTGG